jgi:hypothetical protein
LTENAYSQLREGYFTVDIKKNADGVFTFGSIDANRFSTALTYMPVRNWNQWIVEISGYQVGTNGSVTQKTLKALIGMIQLSHPQYRLLIPLLL